MLFSTFVVATIDGRTRAHPKLYALAVFTTIPVFSIVLFVAGDIVHRAACLRNPTIFLDKTCIHQTDALRKKAGIEKLGAFLFHSRRVLVLFTDLYLKKLWELLRVDVAGGVGVKTSESWRGRSPKGLTPQRAHPSAVA